MSKRGLDNRDELPVADDFSLPSSDIEETDRAVFDLFDKLIPFQVKIKDQSTKVPVVFSTGERFALTRRKSPIRDKNSTLILPLIALYRKSIDLSAAQAGYGTPIAPRDQELYIVKKRLSPKDVDYQRILNRFHIKNQSNVASRANLGANLNFPGNEARPGTIASRRNAGNLAIGSRDSSYLLKNNTPDNIFEIITAPYPTFMLISYEITFWTQYTQQMNQMIEVMMARFSGQDHGFKIKGPNGYEYVAFLKAQLTTQDNFVDFSAEERIIKYTFSIDVPSYLFAPQHEGLPAPFRKYFSAPQIEFGYVQTRTQVVTREKNPEGIIDQNKFILSEIDTVEMNQSLRGQGSEELVEVITNPFTGEKSTTFSKVLTKHERSGETVASSRITVDLETTFDSTSSE